MDCTHFILWASVFPPDLNEDSMSISAETKSVVWGSDDPYFDKEKWKSIEEEHEKKGFQTHFFNGKHDIDARELKHILKL